LVNTQRFVVLQNFQVQNKYTEISEKRWGKVGNATPRLGPRLKQAILESSVIVYLHFT